MPCTTRCARWSRTRLPAAAASRVTLRAVLCLLWRRSFAPSATDAAVLAALGGKTVDEAKFPNVARYVSHISHFSADARSK